MTHSRAKPKSQQSKDSLFVTTITSVYLRSLQRNENSQHKWARQEKHKRKVIPSKKAPPSWTEFHIAQNAILTLSRASHPSRIGVYNDNLCTHLADCTSRGKEALQISETEAEPVWEVAAGRTGVSAWGDRGTQTLDPRKHKFILHYLRKKLLGLCSSKTMEKANFKVELLIFFGSTSHRPNLAGFLWNPLV